MTLLKNLLLTTSLLITTATIAAEKSTDSTNMPIDLEADSGTYDQIAGLATYTGNVKVTQGVATIWADKLTIVLKNNVAQRIEATGKPVKFKYKSDKQPIDGQGKQAIYEVSNKTITLTGDAIVKQGIDVVKGTELIYHLDQEIIQGQRVKMTFQPK